MNSLEILNKWKELVENGETIEPIDITAYQEDGTCVIFKNCVPEYKGNNTFDVQYDDFELSMGDKD